MTGRRYRQHCALAKSLDVVGERWALLIVRELLDGPKRYVDLMHGLVSVSTDVLASRLRDLEAAGLVERSTQPPPSGARVYSLTPAGAGLEDVINAYARWGRALIEERDPDDVLHPEWLGRAVRALIRDDRPGVDLTARFSTPEGTVTLRITPDAVEARSDDEPATVTLTGEVEDLAVAMDPQRARDLIASGDLEVEGEPAAVRALAHLFV